MKNKNSILFIILSLSLSSFLQGWPMKGFEKLNPQQEERDQEKQKELSKKRVGGQVNEEERAITMPGIKEGISEEHKSIPEIFDIDQLNRQIIAAQEAEQTWREMQQWIQNDASTISFEEKANFLEEARDAVEYWKQLREEALAIPEEAAEDKTKEIFKFSKVSLQAAQEAQTAQELMEKLIGGQTFSFPEKLSELSMKKLFLMEPEKLTTFEKGTLADIRYSSSQEEEVSYHASEIVKLLSDLCSPQPEKEEGSYYKKASRLLEKFSQVQHPIFSSKDTSQNTSGISKPPVDSLAKQAKSFREQAQKLQALSQKQAQEACAAYEKLEYTASISFYKKALQFAEEAQAHAKNAAATYKAPAWQKVSKEMADQLNDKIKEWNIKRCQIAQKLAERNKKDAEEQNNLAAQEEKNEIGETWYSMTRKFQVISNHFKKAGEAYELGNEENAKEYERKAEVIQERVNNLRKDIEDLQNQMAIWKRDYQTEASRYLETQEEPQSDRTKIVKLIYKRRFVGPLIRIERVIDYKGNILEEAKMAAEHLLITLNDGEAAEGLLQNLQVEFPNRNLEIKELSKGSRLYALHFLSTSEHPFSRLDMLSALQRKLTEEHLVKNCSPDYLMQLCSSKKQARDSIEIVEEPWSFSSPYGIHPPSDLFDPVHPAVSLPLSPIRIAVLDSGILPSHRGLENCILSHEDEAGERFFGYNALKTDDIEKGLPIDLHGHGTHVAGIIAAAPYEVTEVEVKKQKAHENDPDIFELQSIKPALIRGVASIPNMVQLIICKWIEPDQAEGFAEHAIQCVEYARNQGAKILNCSWSRPLNGSGNFSLPKIEELKNKLKNPPPPLLQEAPDIAVVATAGNYHNLDLDSPQRDKDLHPVYPASFGLSNLISVAATNKKGALAKFSNYGKQSIQVTAPGREIISTSCSREDAYRVLSGTSMAAPHVTAAIALMMAKFPYLSCEKIIDHLCQQAGKTQPPEIKVYYGRLHLTNALSEPISEKTALEEELEEYQKKLGEDKNLSLK